jgi:uncharacterized membrane protein
MVKRIGFIDAARGLAVLMMVVYHIIFDLDYFGMMSIDLFSPPLLIFQRIIGSSFLIIAGISMGISDKREGEGNTKHILRALKLGAVAALITIATWIYPHEGFITFGIIHLMALSALIGPGFFGFGKWNVPLGLAILIIGSIPPGLESDSPYLFWLGLPSPEYTALDYYPLLPWFGMVLIGIYAGRKFFPGGKSVTTLPKLPLQDALEAAGKNSLAIYLAHQPLIIAVLLLIQNIV